MNFSEVLIQKIEDRLFKIEGWQSSIPVALGSWARGELCLKSDIDLVFLGSEEKISEIVKVLQAEGFKVRARVPEDLFDWTLGVQAKDILAILTSKALTIEGEKAALLQKEKILKDSGLCRLVFREVFKDRKERHLKFDSLHNFLEPNLKLNPGGLRDIEQALQILPVVDKKGTLGSSHAAIKALHESKEFLLQIRHKLHSMGFHDQLIATEQKEVSQALGFKDVKEFMRQVSKTFSRAHFYSGWVFEFFKASSKKRNAIEQNRPQRPEDLMSLLRKDSSLLMQRFVRSKMDQVHSLSRASFSEKQRVLLLREAILYRTEDALTQAIFQSRWISHLNPRIKPLVGYVQHDQYHRLAAEAHVLQTCREVKRIWKSDRLLGDLAWLHKKLSAKDWEILSWVAFYHDIAKGQKGDHSVLGALAVREDLALFGVNSSLIELVAFLVENHLQLSIAAFRKNPQDPKTWRELFELGFDAHKLHLLAIFTVIDIRATNVEAWNKWKSTLLSEAVKRFQDPNHFQFYTLAQTLITEFSPALIDTLDLNTVQYFSKKTIEKDLLLFRPQKNSSSSRKSLLKSPQKNFQALGDQSESLKVLKDKKNKNWLRICRKQDAAGLFEAYVRAIFLSGASIEQALIQTLPDVGVYDLFQVRSRLSSQQLLKRVQAGLSQEMSLQSPPEIKLTQIEVVSKSDHEIVLSFKGVDQRGFLWAIASELQKEGVSIVSARVHTWGRQVEDLIHIKPVDGLDVIVAKLKARWITFSLENSV